MDFMNYIIKNGKLQEIYNYKFGELNRLYEYWNLNGKLCALGYYNKGLYGSVYSR